MSPDPRTDPSATIVSEKQLRDSGPTNLDYEGSPQDYGIVVNPSAIIVSVVKLFVRPWAWEFFVCVCVCVCVHTSTYIVPIIFYNLLFHLVRYFLCCA